MSWPFPWGDEGDVEVRRQISDWNRTEIGFHSRKFWWLSAHFPTMFDTVRYFRAKTWTFIKTNKVGFRTKPNHTYTAKTQKQRNVKLHNIFACRLKSLLWKKQNKRQTTVYKILWRNNLWFKISQKCFFMQTLQLRGQGCHVRVIARKLGSWVMPWEGAGIEQHRWAWSLHRIIGNLWQRSV